MARKRMFSREVTDCDAFIELTIEAQALYFRLGLAADDDGMVGNPKMILRLMGLEMDTVEELEDSGFIYRFESGNLLIRHWHANNNLQNDRIKPTIHQEDFKRVLLDKESGVYILDTERIQNGNQYSIDHISLDNKEVSIGNRRGLEKEEPLNADPSESSEADLQQAIRDYLGEDCRDQIRLLDVADSLCNMRNSRAEKIELLREWIANGEQPI